ncbi:hypothetical protein ECANGB1_2264 [Enterospora canceri]|uniref:5'-3' DNA helicase ZGRF1-like N-terminal domain-containing protein n=1 Tax=Enterospora canceri TaxID=1081671 RepID=A0A1Y1S5Y9_9MICR|nr:hypothetical protein ECANGB1_2264 [Enterospora canceri]
MKECTYSKCPQAKKRKKWLDGFVKQVRGKMRLFDSNKKVIYESEKYFIDKDDSLRMSVFTVEVDDYTFMSKDLVESEVTERVRETPKEFQVEKDVLKIEKKMKNENRGKMNMGRSNAEILELIRK